jgi:exonuclease VII large subunit
MEDPNISSEENEPQEPAVVEDNPTKSVKRPADTAKDQRPVEKVAKEQRQAQDKPKELAPTGAEKLAAEKLAKEKRDLANKKRKIELESQQQMANRNKELEAQLLASLDEVTQMKEQHQQQQKEMKEMMAQMMPKKMKLDEQSGGSSSKMRDANMAGKELSRPLFDEDGQAWFPSAEGMEAGKRVDLEEDGDMQLYTGPPGVLRVVGNMAEDLKRYSAELPPDSPVRAVLRMLQRHLLAAREEINLHLAVHSSLSGVSAVEGPTSSSGGKGRGRGGGTSFANRKGGRGGKWFSQ